MSDGQHLDELVFRWIADYNSRLAWLKYEQQTSISAIYQFICVEKPAVKVADVPVLKSVDDVELRSRLLIEIMYKLANGESLYLSDVDKGKKTLLEDAVDALDRLLSDTSVQEIVTLAEVSRLKLAIRRQAVYCCCRADNFPLSASVFVRQWSQRGGDKEREMCQQVAKVVSEKNSSDARLASDSYPAMLEESYAFLRKVFSSLQPPFLVSAAQSVSEKIQQLPQSDQLGSTTSESRLRKGDKSNSAFETPKQPGARSNDEKNSSLKGKKKKPKLEVTSGKNATGSGSKAVPAKVGRGRGSLGRKSLTPLASMSNAQVKDELDDNNSDGDMETPMEGDSFSGQRQDNGDGGRRKPRGKAGLWTAEEEECVFLGVMKFGPGNWHKFSADLPKRTSVDIKDKWRTMVRQGKIDLYEKIHGKLTFAVEADEEDNM